MKINNILVINQPVGNRGDESAHRALMQSLNEALPDAHVTVLAFQDFQNAIDEFCVKSTNNRYVNFLFRHNYMAYEMSEFVTKHNVVKLGTELHPVLRKLKRYYKEADVVICAPGGICMGGFQNWRHLYLLQMARWMHKPMVYYSRSIGPFPVSTPAERRFRKQSLELLGDFTFLSLRDRKSKELARSMGIPFTPSVDTAFLRQPQVCLPDDLCSGLGNDYVVFVPNELTWHFAFKTVPQDTVDRFYLFIMSELRDVYPQANIVMLPQLCSLGEKGDYRYFSMLQQKSNDPKVVVLPDTYSSDVQQTVISRAQMVVGARYHSVVFAINNEIPFVALGYEHKIGGLLEDLSLTDHMVDITRGFDGAKASFSRVLHDCKDRKPDRQYAHGIAADCLAEMLNCLKNLKG